MVPAFGSNRQAVVNVWRLAAHWGNQQTGAATAPPSSHACAEQHIGTDTQCCSAVVAAGAQGSSCAGQQLSIAHCTLCLCLLSLPVPLLPVSPLCLSLHSTDMTCCHGKSDKFKNLEKMKEEVISTGKCSYTQMYLEKPVDINEYDSTVRKVGTFTGIW